MQSLAVHLGVWAELRDEVSKQPRVIHCHVMLITRWERAAPHYSATSGPWVTGQAKNLVVNSMHRVRNQEWPSEKAGWDESEMLQETGKLVICIGQDSRIYLV